MKKQKNVYFIFFINVMMQYDIIFILTLIVSYHQIQNAELTKIKIYVIKMIFFII